MYGKATTTEPMSEGTAAHYARVALRQKVKLIDEKIDTAIEEMVSPRSDVARVNFYVDDLRFWAQVTSDAENAVAAL